MKKFTPYIISSIKLRSWAHLEQPDKDILLNTLRLEYAIKTDKGTTIIIGLKSTLNTLKAITEF